MIITRIIPIILLAFLSACASLVKIPKDPTQFSAMDYPYIEKFHEGVRLKARGQVDDAISLFEQCILLRQDDDAPYYALSQLYLIKNDPKKSAEFIQEAANLDPTNIWYTQEMAYMFFEQGKFQEALKNFEKLVKNQPNNVEWLYGYAECLVKVGKTAEAIKALDKTEDQVGKHPDLTLQKFKLYVEIKQPEKGIQEIELARKQFPDDPQLIATLVDYYFQTGKEEKATLMLEELVRTAPENGRAHLALADVYRQKGNQAKAYQELKEAFICEDVTIDTKMKILINVHESSFKIDPEIYELVELIVSQYPQEAKAHSIRGDFMLKAEKEDEALISYKEALKYDKSQYPIWNQVMIMEYKKGKFTDLFEDSKVCLEYFPTIPTVYLLNGLSAVQLKKYETAVSVLDAGKDLVVNDKSLEAEIYAQLGEAYFGLKNINIGKENFEKAMVLDPKSALVRNNYAYRLALAKTDLERATMLIDQILAENSEVAHFVDTKGFILFQQGKYKEAMVYFEKAFKLKPLDKIIVEHMGDGSMKLGDKEKAIEYWVKAKELGSTNLNLNKKIEKKEFYEPLY
jgi:tetratricopeptide (TPR) repeat protein